jgi:transcriptional regulator with XRE-family HTH domain
MRAARQMTDLPQDRLGVLIGLDEMCSSARISRYEGGVHEPPFKTAERIAAALNVPVAYFYCPDETLAQLLLVSARLPKPEQERLLALAQERLAGVEQAR